jgi:hypothetical protein
MGSRLALCLLFVVCPLGVSAQSDPQAVGLAGKAYFALTGGLPVESVSVSAQATWIAGSDEFQGTAQLEALGARQLSRSTEPGRVPAH